MTAKLLRTKRAGAFHPIERPWVRSGGAWLSASKVFRKESGAWVEWWPLRPLPPTNVTAVFSYRNDRIEVDIDWTAPVGGPDIATYTVEVEEESPLLSATVVPTTWSPDYAWQGLAGDKVRARVYATTPTGMTGDSAYSAFIPVPQLPPPPVPTAVDVEVLPSRQGQLTWAHVGGNRLSSFETRTTYQGSTVVRSIDKIDPDEGPTTWAQDVTAWEANPPPGDPGGGVSALVRAIGPGGTSDWASDDAVVPYVPLPPPPPPAIVIPPAPAPPSPAPGAAALPARFYNGDFIVDYSCPGAASVLCWWESLSGGVGSGLNLIGSLGPSGRLTVPGSQGWARDEVTQYRIHMEGVSADGTHGPLSVSPWCRKLPNPFLVYPVATVVRRSGVDITDGVIRQGGSEHGHWQSYAMYGGVMQGAFNPSRIGYGVTVTDASVLMWREPTGGSGGAVSPRIHYHTYSYAHEVAGVLLGGHDGTAMPRDYWIWQQLQLDYARQLVGQSEPAVRGVGIYHPNGELLPWLGNVSAEYMRIGGIGAALYGIPSWTVRFYHDG